MPCIRELKSGLASGEATPDYLDTMAHGFMQRFVHRCIHRFVRRFMSSAFPCGRVVPQSHTGPTYFFAPLFRRPDFLLFFLFAASAIIDTASSIVSSSGSIPRGRLAFAVPSVTYGP